MDKRNRAIPKAKKGPPRGSKSKKSSWKKSSRTLAWISLFLVCVLGSLSLGSNYFDKEVLGVNDFSYPVKIASYPKIKEPEPVISAASYAVVDFDSGVMLAEKNSRIKMFPASLTKLMTALVAMEYFHLDDVLTVKNLVKQEDEADMGLEVGDQLTVRNLLYGLLVPSGNDAAYVLADNYPGGLPAFVSAMNQKARELHMNQSHFVNPSGIDDSFHYSSVSDLVLLARSVLQNSEISKIVSTKSVVLSDITGRKKYYTYTVNQLLGFAGIDGIKTGFTDFAGQCLILSAKKNDHRIITVVLKSADRFTESLKLVNWVFNSVTWLSSVAPI